MFERTCKKFIGITSYILMAVLAGRSFSSEVTLKVPSFAVKLDLDKLQTCVCGDGTVCNASLDNFYGQTNNDNFVNITRISPQTESLSNSYYICLVDGSFSSRKISCRRHRSYSYPCIPDTCSVNIIVSCADSSRNVPLVWSTSQVATVENSAPLFNCCSASLTTTEATSAFLTSDGTTTPASATIEQKETSNNDAKSPLEEGTSAYPTTKMLSIGQQNGMHQNTNNADFQITPAHIGIIIGTAVAAILVTVAVMCAVWRIKNRRRNQPKDTAGSNDRPGNDSNITADNVKAKTNENVKQQQRNIAHISPLVSGEKAENNYDINTDSYTYIDIPQSGCERADRRLQTALPTAPPASNTRDSEYTGYNELRTGYENDSKAVALNVEEITSVYSKLREEKSVLDNPYNWFSNQSNNEIIHSSYAHPQKATNSTLHTHFEAQPSPKNSASQETDVQALDVIDVHPPTYTEPSNSTNRQQRFRDAKGSKTLEIAESSGVTYADVRPKRQPDLVENNQLSTNKQEDKVNQLSTNKQEDKVNQLSTSKQEDKVNQLSTNKQKDKVNQLSTNKQEDIINQLSTNKQEDKVNQLSTIKQEDKVNQLSTIKQEDKINQLSTIKQEDKINQLSTIKQEDKINQLSTIKQEDKVMSNSENQNIQQTNSNTDSVEITEPDLAQTYENIFRDHVMKPTDWIDKPPIEAASNTNISDETAYANMS